MNTPEPRSGAPEAAVTPADSHGAIDLSARASAPALGPAAGFILKPLASEGGSLGTH